MEAVKDEMTAAFDDQLNDDLAKQAEAASASFVWDEGYYLAQYKKHTLFASDKESFERKDGSGSFANIMYQVPVGAFVFDLMGFTGRKGEAIVQWDKPKGFSFKATFRTVKRDDGKLVPESINGGLMQAAATKGGCTSNKTADMIDWFANHLVVIHVGAMKASADGKWPAKNIVRSITPYNG